MCMPRGNPKKPTIIRLDPALIAEFRSVAGTDANFSAAVAEGLRWWIDRYKRRQRAQADPLAKYPTPPTASALKARKGEAALRTKHRAHPRGE
jgi:hypothetical protein